MCQRPSSTQTRIKTGVTVFNMRIQAVRDHLPLKQGLRHCNSYLHALHEKLVRDHLPLKQGLRH